MATFYTDTYLLVYTSESRPRRMPVGWPHTHLCACIRGSLRIWMPYSWLPD